MGSDEHGARRALTRAVFPIQQVLSIRVARAADLIGWDLDAGAVDLGFLEQLEIAPDRNELAPLPASSMLRGEPGNLVGTTRELGRAP